MKWISCLYLCVLFCSAGCSDYQLRLAAKSDTDLVLDAHIQKTNELLQALMIKLYKRNPKELQKVPKKTVQTRLQEVFSSNTPKHFTELGQHNGMASLDATFDPDYPGDRVFSFIVGLSDMIHKSYRYQSEFFMLDSVDEQDLYNSARNIETLVWRTKHRLDRDGKLFLLTNGHENNVENFSFERIFGKLIMLQDMMARITADRTNRAINQVVHSVASSVLLPIGL